MKIINEYPVKIFSKDYEGKTYYKMGLSKKDKEGHYVNGYIDARFRKDIKVDTDKRIYIKDAWLDFYLDKDNKTKLYIFINEFSYVEDVIEESKIYIDELELNDNDMPF